MHANVTMMIAAFGGISSLVILVFLVLGSRQGRIEARLVEESAPSGDGFLLSARSALRRLGLMLLPSTQARLARVQSRLLQAGLYRQHSSALFAAMKFILMVAPILVGVILGATGVLEWSDGILYGVLVGVLGTVLPGLWISRLKKARQSKIRRALPDALDVIVICLEGGLSMPGAFGRVTEELGTAYPLLATEMGIVRKQIELGHSTADAFRVFADRFDIEELKSLAMLIGQAERFGASLVKTLRIQADSLRQKRYQWAEGQAQKAPLKLIFPTVLCIFPALYIVLMGPAGVQLYELLSKMGP